MEAAVDKLKAKLPQALLSMDYLSFIVNMTLCKSDDSSEDDAIWMEEEEEENNCIELMTEENASNVEKALSNSVFVHRRTYQSDMASALLTMHSHLKEVVTSNSRE